MTHLNAGNLLSYGTSGGPFPIWCFSEWGMPLGSSVLVSYNRRMSRPENASFFRPGDRKPNQLRPLTLTPGYVQTAEGSVLVSASAFAAAPKADSVVTARPVRVSTGGPVLVAVTPLGHWTACPGTTWRRPSRSRQGHDISAGNKATRRLLQMPVQIDNPTTGTVRKRNRGRPE